MVDELPSFFHFVASREECGIARHGIEKQALVSFRAAFSEAGGVVEIHLHRFEAETGAGQLRDHPQRNPLVRLDPDDEDIATGNATGQSIEKHAGSVLEMDRNLSRLLRQALAHADVKRDTAPAPGVDQQADRDVGLGRGLRIDSVFLAVPGNRSAIDVASGVLGADHIRRDLFRRVPLTQ